MLEELLEEFFLLLIVLSFPPLLAASMSGLLLGVLQAATQIQEQSLQFVVKTSAAGIVLFFLLDWYSIKLSEYFRGLYALLRGAW